ncbi:MAG: Heat shock 70 kDa protein 12A [Geoglossum umbratile]|nr:MAG: Heat shock 70 kDa protein 12A [Geoglossum umbratile]
MSRIMRSWGKAKEEFNGEKGKYVEADPEFPVDYTDATLDIKDGLLELSVDTMKGLFDPICNRIKALIYEQNQLLPKIKRTAKGILMVGGLSRNEHLFRTLESRYSPNIKVLRPDRDVVCYGAVQIALSPELETTHMSPFSFGLGFQGGGTRWFIVQGDFLRPGYPKTAHAFYEISSASFGHPVTITCRAVLSQEYTTATGHTSDVIQPELIEPLGSFEVKLSAASLDGYPVTGGGGGKKRKFKEVKLTFELYISLWSISIMYGLHGTKREGWDTKVIPYPTKRKTEPE